GAQRLRRHEPTVDRAVHHRRADGPGPRAGGAGPARCATAAARAHPRAGARRWRDLGAQRDGGLRGELRHRAVPHGAQGTAGVARRGHVERPAAPASGLAGRRRRRERDAGRGHGARAGAHRGSRDPQCARLRRPARASGHPRRHVRSRRLPPGRARGAHGAAVGGGGARRLQPCIRTGRGVARRDAPGTDRPALREQRGDRRGPGARGADRPAGWRLPQRRRPGPGGGRVAGVRRRGIGTVATGGSGAAPRNPASWSIRNPIPAAMLFVLLTLGGLMSFRAMKVQNFPDMDLPIVIVTASLPGASPGQLESDVARKIEDSIATLQGLRHITSNLTDGGVTIGAEFRLENPVQEAVDGVRSAGPRRRADLPADLRDPVVTKLEPSSQPILAYAIASSRLDDQELSWFIDDTLTRRLLAVQGVGAVSRVGGVTREVRVALDPARMQALGATAAEISRRLREVQLESAGGRAELGGAEQPLRTLATLRTAQEIAALEIPISGGRHVRLDQVASVTDTVAEPRAAALLDGRP